MIPNTHVVKKEEIHYLPQCPCDACAQERARIAAETHPHVFHFKPADARILGFIPHLTPQGSLCRQITEQQKPDQYIMTD